METSKDIISNKTTFQNIQIQLEEIQDFIKNEADLNDVKEINKLLSGLNVNLYNQRDRLLSKAWEKIFKQLNWSCEIKSVEELQNETKLDQDNDIIYKHFILKFPEGDIFVQIEDVPYKDLKYIDPIFPNKCSY